MNDSSFDGRTDPGGAAPIGPAVSRRRPAGSAALPSPAEPLPPFVRPGWSGWSAAAPAVAAPAEAPPPEPDLDLEPEPEGADLTAILEEMVASEPEDDFAASLAEAATPEGPDEDEPEDGLGLVRGAEWGLSESTDELMVEVTDQLWEDAPETREPEAPETEEPEAPREPVPVEPAAWRETVLPQAEAPAPPLESASDEALADWSLAASAAPEAERAPETPAEAEPPEEVLPVQAEQEGGAPAPRAQEALAEAMSLEEGPALQEVAGRLERIALALREGRPVELFSSGSSDPLEVLIAGYALGYSEAFRRVSEERRKGQ